MAEVTLWSREQTARVPAGKEGADLLAVTYSTTSIPPRSVLLPRGNYREASHNERMANPRLPWIPADKAAEDAELAAIRADMDQVAASAPPTLEVP